jgi:glycosyltransferase involved in cell wall biosynthesis
MKVSVIITCHNESAYIEQCINSIIDQTDYDNIYEHFKLNSDEINLIENNI